MYQEKEIIIINIVTLSLQDVRLGTWHVSLLPKILLLTL